MHILITVFFKAVHGGLHENIRATARHLVSNKHKVTLVCPPGPFADSLQEEGISVVRTDYSDIASVVGTIRDIHASSPFSLVHAHPFASRKAGLRIAKRLNLPFVLTIHGKYTDDLSSYNDTVAAVLTVSAGIRDHLLQECDLAPEKLFVIPNVPDPHQFYPVDRESVRVARDIAAGPFKIGLVSRLDQDKEFILDVFADAVEHAAKKYPGMVAWQVVGDGTQAEKLRQRLEKVRGSNTVVFSGWLEGDALLRAYQSNDCVIAPGRCALEAMSCSVPVIAVGSKGYCGLICEENWQKGVYSNFGGVGKRHEDYSANHIQRDLDKVLSSAKYRNILGGFSNRLVRQFFNGQQVQNHLLDIYWLVIAAHRMGSIDEAVEIDTLTHEGAVMQSNDESSLMIGEIKRVEQALLDASSQASSRSTRDLLIVQNRLYSQLEKLGWLMRSLKISYSLPPLRGWAASPDVLLKLHEHIQASRPRLVVEFGSGASTVVIADALRQNGIGKLVSFEHDIKYAEQTSSYLRREHLDAWVDLRVGELVEWTGQHLAIDDLSGDQEESRQMTLEMKPQESQKNNQKTQGESATLRESGLRWYDASFMLDLEGIDLLFVDGPPGGTCKYARYPALPALADRLSRSAEVWMDDTIRQEEKDICEGWSKQYDLSLEYIEFEKGLGRLRKQDV